MLLSRFWYVLLSLVLGFALYVSYLAVGQYNRRNSVAMAETLASDSQVVGWALQIDARRRLDALLVGAVDKNVQECLLTANGKEKIPGAAKEQGKKALVAVNEKMHAEFRNDATFAVDRDGRVVAQVGFDQATTFDDFELGGYAAVYDALHGYLRDDTWVMGGKIYRVVARPVEYDVTQPPAGAIVGLKLIDPRFAQEIARRTRANVAFYSAGVRVAAGAAEGFEDAAFDALATDLGKIEGDKGYKDTGRSDVRPVGDNLGAMYAKLVGESWELGAGFAVVRTKVAVAGPMGFLNGADDKDKASVPVALVAAVALLGILVGLGLSYFEHSMPLKDLARQAEALRKGQFDLLQLPKLRGAYRAIAQEVNGGIERVAEKGGGAPRKTADLESILGPAPAQPAMSAFAFPQMTDGGVATPAMGSAAANMGSGARPMPMPPASAGGSGARPAPTAGSVSGPIPTMGSVSAPFPMPSNPGSVSGPLPQMPGGAGSGSGTGKPPPPGSGGAPVTARPPPGQHRPIADMSGEDDEEATMVAQIPAEVLAAATGEYKALEEGAEWLSVYEDFVRTKKQCGESTDGLTFEKFQHTLRKNRDALMQRHGCKRVKFSVYVKEGRASLKATPVKD